VTVVESPPGTPEVDEAQLLFREARRRRRRRWLAVGIILSAGAILVVAITALVGSTATTPARPRPPEPRPPRPVGLPTGRFQSLGVAGPLAVNASGSLFVVDDAHDEVLVRLDDGRFRVVAGDGRVGFSGDGGPATGAELSDVSEMAFGPNGDLYLADGARVRMIDPEGTIETVVGNGGPATTVADGTKAGSASLGDVGSVTVAPGGSLYLATSNQILRLGRDGELQPVTALAKAENTVYGGAGSLQLSSFGQIAVDAEGDVYASSAALGWSVYKITPDGTATYLGAARRSGGNTAVVQLGPNGAAYADDGSYVVRAEGDRLATAYRLGRVPGIPESYFLDYFAFGADGTVYADNLGSSAFNRDQEIVSVGPRGHSALLWSHRNH
jgi:hypothetical protein